jgi:hypothetical protein
MKKQKNTMLAEQLQSQISKSKNEAKLIPLSHKYMTVHFTGLVHALQYKLSVVVVVVFLVCFLFLLIPDFIPCVSRFSIGHFLVSV